MNRALLNLMIDSIAAALLTAMVGTGYILSFALPPGTNRTHVLWGLLRHQWGVVHFWTSAMLLAALAVHVALHWRWLVTGLSKRSGVAGWADRSPRLAGLVVLGVAALPLTILATAAHVSVRSMDMPLHPLADEPGGGAADVASAGATREAVAARAAAIVAERCASCHGGPDPAAGVRADTPEALQVEQHGIRWIAAGRPDESQLLSIVGVQSAARGITPKHRLTQSEMDALRAWIASLGG
jgi:mono/diheme cytochrome c family protein